MREEGSGNSEAWMVSIVMPVRDSAATLQESVRSIICQTYKNWELWIVDDGSRDNSAGLINTFCSSDGRIKSVLLPDRCGVATARNIAIELARGRYIAFLDSDDLWDPQKLSRQVETMSEGASFSFSAYRRIDMAGREIGKVRVPSRLDYTAALRGNSVGCLTAMYDTQVYGKVFMPNIVRRQDYALWLKLLRREGPGYGIQDCLASYRVRPGSLSADWRQAATATWRVFRDFEGLGLLKAGYCYCFYIMSALKKRL